LVVQPGVWVTFPHSLLISLFSPILRLIALYITLVYLDCVVIVRKANAIGYGTLTLEEETNCSGINASQQAKLDPERADNAPCVPAFDLVQCFTKRLFLYFNVNPIDLRRVISGVRCRTLCTTEIVNFQFSERPEEALPNRDTGWGHSDNHIP